MQENSVLLELLIDGLPVSFGEIFPHPQKAPYPGKNQYVLSLMGNDLGNYFQCLELSSETELKTNDFEKVFWYLNCLLTDYDIKLPTTKIRFVLNTIQSISISPDRVRIEGICSKFQT